MRSNKIKLNWRTMKSNSPLNLIINVISNFVLAHLKTNFDWTKLEKFVYVFYIIFVFFFGESLNDKHSVVYRDLHWYFIAIDWKHCICPIFFSIHSSDWLAWQRHVTNSMANQFILFFSQSEILYLNPCCEWNFMT